MVYVVGVEGWDEDEPFFSHYGLATFAIGSIFHGLVDWCGGNEI